MELFGRFFRTNRKLHGLGAYRWSYFGREVKGHERMAALVHPFNASSWIQDREDRKRSGREHSTNAGARFMSRIL